MKQAGGAPRNCVLLGKSLLLEETCPVGSRVRCLQGGLRLGRGTARAVAYKVHSEAGGRGLSGTGRIPLFFYYFQLCLKTRL